jgi:hypothetical protein
MGGLAILLIVILYIALAVWLVVRARGWWRKATVGLIAFLLPTADGYLGRKYVEHLCAKDSGLKVYRVVKDVEGVLGLAPDRQTLKRTGFRFIEYAGSFSDPKRAYRRIERLPDGQVVEGFDTKSRARFKVEKQHGGTGFPTHIAISDVRVIDSASGELVAQFRKYSGGVGWAERFLAKFTGAGYAQGVECVASDKPIGPDELVMRSLHPSGN